MDIKTTLLYCSIRDIIHRLTPLIREQINSEYMLLREEIWENLKQEEIIQQYESNWCIYANLSNMIWDTETLKPIGSVFGNIRIEHYPFRQYVTLSFCVCNLLLSANNDFANHTPIKYEVNIQDLNDKEKIVLYLGKLENFLYSFPEHFMKEVNWINSNLEDALQNEKCATIIRRL